MRDMDNVKLFDLFETDPSEKKEYHLAHNLKTRCIKKKVTRIHAFFLRDHVLRQRMLEHDRDEDVCREWDLAEQGFNYRMSKPEYFHYRQLMDFFQ